ncbi:uncharacterized protein LOC114737527 [Neltuma alba]|uniref:uncharacterized protein LOC114737527 n=1 Tax=Neltuma alba TaxID=207710 RepID=UPI0010A457A3|nr:uncharacterized protein LOC114737527 [Prosopis alba]
MDGDKRDSVIKCTIWDFVASVSAINGLVCFALGDVYKKSFGKLGMGGLVIYLSVGLIVCMLIWLTRKIKVEEGFQVPVLSLVFGLTCLASTILDMLGSGKADVFSIISYGSFALMSLSVSRKSELGFETGFSSFFLSLFASQFPKINRLLTPIAIVLCSVTFYIFRSTQRGGGQHDSTNPNNDAHLRGVEQQSSSDRIPETDLRQELFRRARFSRTLPSTSSSKYSVETFEHSIGQVKMAEPKQSLGDHKRHTNVEQSSGDHKERTNVEESSGDRIFSEKEEQTKEPSSHDSSLKEARIDMMVGDQI